MFYLKEMNERTLPVGSTQMTAQNGVVSMTWTEDHRPRCRLSQYIIYLYRRSSLLLSLLLYSVSISRVSGWVRVCVGARQTDRRFQFAV